MPLQQIPDERNPGSYFWRWGDTGTVYRTRKAALKQGRAIKARQEGELRYELQLRKREELRAARELAGSGKGSTTSKTSKRTKDTLEELEERALQRKERRLEKLRTGTYSELDRLADRGERRKLKAARRQARLKAGLRVSPEPEPEPEEVRIPTKRGRPIGSIYRRDDLTAREAQRRRRGGAQVNPTIPVPDPPCETLDAEMCTVCGEYVKEISLGANSVSAASQLIRQSAGGYSAGGGYRSRGPLLWAMHVNKLQRFYERHLEHCELLRMFQEDTGSDFVPIPPSVIWAESFGDPTAAKLAELFQDQQLAEQSAEPFRDWTVQPMAPIEYSPAMTITLLRLRDLLDSSQERNRKKLELPSRETAGRRWDELADRVLAEPVPIDEDETPF